MILFSFMNVFVVKGSLQFSLVSFSLYFSTSVPISPGVTEEAFADVFPWVVVMQQRCIIVTKAVAFVSFIGCHSNEALVSV